MATLTHSGSRRLYSWWWDSHISPKNSKWLQENLTDMDVKVKAMIKLIEEDADSFARRAEMYYKKRPELMKLVEEIYRAYRALAERYDHATVELRQAQRTMAEAFPNQVPYDLIEDTPSETSCSGPEEPRTPETPHPIGKLCDLNDEDVISELSSENQNLRACVETSEKEIQNIQGMLSKIESEKEAIFLKYQQALENLSNLESKLDNSQREAVELDQQASKAEIEMKILKEALSGIEAERNASFLQYNQSLERISTLENSLSLSREEAKALDMRARKAKTESQYLRIQISSLEYEKEASLRQYKLCLEKISHMEAKISAAEENAKVLNNHIERAESEVNSLKKTINELRREKEIASLEYQKCLDSMAKMEGEMFRAQNDGKRLNDELITVSKKLDDAEVKYSRLEESNQVLELEADDLMQKIMMKDEELAQRNIELKKFQTQVQDEQSRFMQVETTLHTLQELHSQSQEEQKSLTLELNNGLQMLKDLGIHKLSVEEELQKIKEENISLNESNLSSNISLAKLENEFFSLKEMKDKLEEEVFRKADYGNSLDREIRSLREEIKGMNGRYQAIRMEVESVGMNPEFLGNSVKELQNENAKLRATCEIESKKGEVLNYKLNSMDKISKDNAILEISLAEMNRELEKIREKAKDFKELYHFLQGEKTTLVCEKTNLLLQLQTITENMQKLLEKNTLLENSLCGANIELEGLRDHSKSLEEFCQLLKSEKSNLLSERDALVSQLENVESKLGILEKRFSNLEEKYTSLENKNESTIYQVEELRFSLVADKEEHASYKTSNETRMSGLETHIQILEQKSKLGKKEFGEELEKAVNGQVEIFVLQKFVEDLEANNCSLLIECQKLKDASKLSNKLIVELERENLEQQVEIEFLVDEIENLRGGIRRVFKAVQFNPENGQKDEIEREKLPLLNILDTVEELKTSFCRNKDEKQLLLVENSVLLTLLGELRLEGEELQTENKFLENEFDILKEEFAMKEKDKHDLQEQTRQLMFEATQKEQHEKFLTREIEIQNLKLENLQRDFLVLHEENSDMLKEKRSELKKFSNLEDAYLILEEDHSTIIEEAIALDIFALVFESFTAEKAMGMKALNEDLDSLYMANIDLKDEVEEKETEILLLNESVKRLDDKVHEVENYNNLLRHEIVVGNNFLRQKVEGLWETEQELKNSRELNVKLCKRVEKLKNECEELRLIRENLEIENLELCLNGYNQNGEIVLLHEMNENLKSEVGELYKEVEECKIREENLSSEVWKGEAASFCFDLQSSAVHGVLLENKLLEITQVCEKIGEESAAKDAEIQILREKARILESEMAELKAMFSGTSVLEQGVLPQTKDFYGEIQHKMNGEIRDNFNGKSCEIQKMVRIEEVEVRVPMNQRKESESEGTSEIQNELDQILKSSTKRSGTGTIMKDIPLDQVSKRENREANDQMLQLWETAEQNIDRTISPLRTVRNQHDEQNYSDSSSELQREKNSGFDGLERSSSIRERSQGGRKKKILHRLASDAQKLTNLQTTVDDLSRRMETKNWSKKEIHIEHEKACRQLKEVEETVLQLVNVNDQLTKNVEHSPSSFAGKNASELERENAARNSMMERARKSSEKIGRLHFEVQNIHHMVLKLEEEKKRRWRMRFSKNKTSIILKDFIYSGKKSSEKHKKNCFCGCKSPATNGD